MNLNTNPNSQADRLDLEPLLESRQIHLSREEILCLEDLVSLCLQIPGLSPDLVRIRSQIHLRLIWLISHCPISDTQLKSYLSQVRELRQRLHPGRDPYQSHLDP